MRQQCNSIRSRIKSFNSSIFIAYHNYSYLSVFNFFLTAYDDDITIIYSNGVHTVPLYPEGKIFSTAIQIGKCVALNVLRSINRESGGDAA